MSAFQAFSRVPRVSKARRVRLLCRVLRVRPLCQVRRVRRVHRVGRVLVGALLEPQGPAGFYEIPIDPAADRSEGGGGKKLR